MESNLAVGAISRLGSKRPGERYRRDGGGRVDARSTTHFTTAEVRSQFGGSWSQILRNKIESYGIGKFEGNTEHVSYKRIPTLIAVTQGHVPNSWPSPATRDDKWHDRPEQGRRRGRSSSLASPTSTIVHIPSPRSRQTLHSLGTESRTVHRTVCIYHV